MFFQAYLGPVSLLIFFSDFRISLIFRFLLISSTIRSDNEIAEKENISTKIWNVPEEIGPYNFDLRMSKNDKLGAKSIT